MSKLLADKLLADPRIAEARKLIAQALSDQQQHIAFVRRPDASLAQGYAEMIERLAEARGGKLFYPYLGSGLGRGPFVELADGSIKYDMIAGIGVNFFGHSNPLLLDALVSAAVRDTVMQGNL